MPLRREPSRAPPTNRKAEHASGAIHAASGATAADDVAGAVHRPDVAGDRWRVEDRPAVVPAIARMRLVKMCRGRAEIEGEICRSRRKEFVLRKMEQMAQRGRPHAARLPFLRRSDLELRLVGQGSVWRWRS